MFFSYLLDKKYPKIIVSDEEYPKIIVSDDLKIKLASEIIWEKMKSSLIYSNDSLEFNMGSDVLPQIEDKMEEIKKYINKEYLHEYDLEIYQFQNKMHESYNFLITLTIKMKNIHSSRM